MNVYICRSLIFVWYCFTAQAVCPEIGEPNACEWPPPQNSPTVYGVQGYLSQNATLRKKSLMIFIYQ